MFCEKSVLENYTKFTGKHLWQSPFLNITAGLGSATLLKKILAQVFFCEFCEVFNNTIFTEHLQWLLPQFKKIILHDFFSKITRLKWSVVTVRHSVCNFLKKRLGHRCFPVNFANFLKTTFFAEHSRSLLPWRHNTKVSIISPCYYSSY